MFSGIIEDVGTLTEITPQGEGSYIWIQTALPLARMQKGESISVDGCCLTLTEIEGDRFAVFASHETLARTTLGLGQVKTQVNLERALEMGARLDGHLVQGHVEGRGGIVGKRGVGDCVEVDIAIPDPLRSLVIPKGSVAVDGISLTINAIHERNAQTVICVNLIPYTLTQTSLGGKAIGQEVNLETDMIGRYVKRYFEITAT